MKLNKKAIAVTISALIATSPAFAGKRENVQAAKSGILFTTAGILGGIAAGPAGLFLGAIAGAHLGEQGKKSLATEIALEEKVMTLNTLEEEINLRELEIANLEKMIDEKMQLQLYFKTGEDALSSTDEESVRALSDFLNENNYMHVSIDGHADPRGTDEYNNVLSNERALSVAEVLKESGIEETRITAKGHGSSFSTSISGNLDEYAKERKVKIEVHSSKDSASYASID